MVYCLSETKELTVVEDINDKVPLLITILTTTTLLHYLLFVIINQTISN